MIHCTLYYYFRMGNGGDPDLLINLKQLSLQFHTNEEWKEKRVGKMSKKFGSERKVRQSELRKEIVWKKCYLHVSSCQMNLAGLYWISKNIIQSKSAKDIWNCNWNSSPSATRRTRDTSSSTIDSTNQRRNHTTRVSRILFDGTEPSQLVKSGNKKLSKCTMCTQEKKWVQIICLGEVFFCAFCTLNNNLAFFQLPKKFRKIDLKNETEGETILD